MQNCLVTLNANDENIIDAFGDATINTHVELEVPLLEVVVYSKSLEHSAVVSAVEFEVVLGSRPDGSTDSPFPRGPVRVEPSHYGCTARLSLPAHHPKSVLCSTVRCGVWCPGWLTVGLCDVCHLVACCAHRSQRSMLRTSCSSAR
jgi:hypothetical protein